MHACHVQRPSRHYYRYSHTDRHRQTQTQIQKQAKKDTHTDSHIHRHNHTTHTHTHRHKCTCIQTCIHTQTHTFTYKQIKSTYTNTSLLYANTNIHKIKHNFSLFNSSRRYVILMKSFWTYNIFLFECLPKWLVRQNSLSYILQPRGVFKARKKIPQITDSKRRLLTNTGSPGWWH